MHHVIRITLVALAVIALGGAAALAQDSLALGKNGDVELRAETLVGSTSLKPGHYRFQHQLVDGQHYVVVRAQTPARSGSTTHYAGATKDEVARVACRLVSTDKQRDTALYTTKAPDGSVRLTQIAVRGEKGSHIFVLEPQS